MYLRFASDNTKSKALFDGKSISCANPQVWGFNTFAFSENEMREEKKIETIRSLRETKTKVIPSHSANQDQKSYSKKNKKLHGIQEITVTFI